MQCLGKLWLCIFQKVPWIQNPTVVLCLGDSPQKLDTTALMPKAIAAKAGLRPAQLAVPAWMVLVVISDATLALLPNLTRREFAKV
jgi:hypothetical protein